MPSLCIGNTVIPFFSAQPFAELCLLIPIVLVEAIVICQNLKIPFKKVLLQCFIANVLSTLCAVIAIPLEIGSYMLMGTDWAALGVLGFLALLVVCFAVSFFVEFVWYLGRWKNLKSRTDIAFATFFANGTTYLPILAAMAVLGGFFHHHQYENSRQISCASHLKQIGLAIEQYAQNCNGFLPSGHGAAGLETLRANNYIAMYEIFICPSVERNGKIKAGEESSPLTDKTVSYLYFGDGMTTADSPDSPIACEKPGNHENYGNVLFLDGHVMGYSGANWMEQAKIPEKERLK